MRRYEERGGERRRREEEESQSDSPAGGCTRRNPGPSGRHRSFLCAVHGTL